jgi:hypothetical protein
VLAGVDWMGEHDWYGRGAEYLLANQEKSGSWSESGPRIVTTCFALLFLKRGTKPVMRGAVTNSCRSAGPHRRCPPTRTV